MLNFFYCHKNKCSKAVEPKSKYISNFSLRKALCFVFVLFCCLGMWGQTVVEYKSKSSLSELKWSEASSWEGGSVPNISGDKEVKIYLDANMEATALEFNKTGENKIHVHLNGNTLVISGKTWFGEKKESFFDSGKGSNIYLYGEGKFFVESLEFGENGPENKLYLNNGVEFYVTKELSPYKKEVQISRNSGESKFYLNASGINVNYYTDDIKIVWNGFEPIPYGEQTFFQIFEDGGNPTSPDGKKITFGKKANDGAATIKFKYKVDIVNTSGVTWTLGSQELTDGYEGSISDSQTGPSDTANEDLPLLTQVLDLKSSGPLNPGDGIIITFRTPDDKMDMCEIRYIKGELLWTGAVSTDILVDGNWSYDETFSEEVLKTNEAIIGSGAVNYPEITGDVTVSKLTVKNGARITVAEGGVLTVNDSLIFEGNSKIDARAGKVVFTGTGTAENPNFKATYPEFSTFGTLEVASGKSFYTNSDLHITTSLTNNGTFTAGKVYLEPSENEVEVTITGQSVDSLEIAEKTKIAELYCENQKGKTLVINGTISVGKIALSGVANQENYRLTVKSENQTGVIYLGEAYEDARFLELNIDNLPTIRNVSNQADEIFIMVADSNISEINDAEKRVKFYEKGWRLPQPLDYTWTGAESTDWFTSSNWLELYVPCENSNVTIKKIETGSYPTLTQNPENLSSLIIEEGASIDFAGQDVTATTITNNGTVRLTGKENITGSITEEGTVHYYKGDGDYPAEFSWGGNYKNLVIENGFSGTMASQNSGLFSTPAELQVSESLAFYRQNDVLGNLKSVSLEGTSITISYLEDNSIPIIIEATGKHVYNGDLVFTEAVSIKSTDGTVSFLGTDNSFENGLTLKAPKSDFTNAGNFSSVNGDITVNVSKFSNTGEILATVGAISVEAKSFTNAEGKVITAQNGFSCETAEEFSNVGTITAENGAISVKAKSFTNAEGKVITAQSGFSCETAEEFSNAGTITVGNGDINVTTASSFENSGKLSGLAGTIKAENGNAVFAATSEAVFTNGLTVECANAFSNAGTITAENGAISVNAKTFTNAEGKLISAKTGFSCETTETVSNAGTITAGNGVLHVISLRFENSGTLSGNEIQIDSPEVIFSGAISSSANINITGNLYVDGDADFSFGENLSVGTSENPKNMVISAIDGDPQTVKSVFLAGGNISLSGNFVLFNGNVSLDANLTVEKDVILLNGETSGTNSIYKDKITGIEGIFAYELAGRGVENKTASTNYDFPPENPIIPISHEEYASSFAIADEKTITVGKNFYSNGVNLGTDENQWTLTIPANDDASKAFAECYNATIKNCTVSSDGEGDAWLSTENCVDGGGNNSNVAFSKAILAEARTISDSIIEVRFVDGNSDEKLEIEIENSCNEISELIETIRFNVSGEISSGKVFSCSYKDLECTQSTDGKGDLSTFYLKYDSPTDGTEDFRWNTDATGVSVGSIDSTDTSGVQKNVVPNLGFVRVVYGGEPQDPKVLYTGLRDKHKNRVVFVAPEGENATYNPLYQATIDNAPPALIAVSIGQEQHEPEATAQHHYDSHNFIEWRFSEPMNFDLGDKTENVLATDDFGTITNKENGFEIAGLGEFQNGKLVLGSKSAGNEISAFYYCDEKNYGVDSVKTRLRLSIAGYVDEANPVTFNGKDYKNWLGFIDGSNSVIPTGTFSISKDILNEFKDTLGNKRKSSENQTFVVNKILLSMTDEQKAVTTYGTWDLDPPKVSNYSREGFITNSAQELIAVDFSYSNKAEGVEIHILDNSLYNPTEEKEGYENLAWKTGRGWKLQGELISPSPIPLDTKGGSRMIGQNQTSGGIRLSSIDVASFSCENLITGEVSTFADFSQITINEAFFGKSGENQFDVPYLSLEFKNITENQFLNHNYQLTYSRKDENGNVRGYITDLAGNLLEDFVANSPDKNPPDFLLSVGGVGKDKLYIIFSKPIDWKTGEQGDEGKLRRIVKSLSIFGKDDVDTGLIDFEKGSRARVLTETDKSTGIEISLTRPVTYEEIKTLHIGVNIFQSGAADSDGDKANTDPISGIPGSFSMLYDIFENPISATSKHIFTDFAVNALEVLYAYDGRNEETAIAGQGVLGGNQWLITDFSETPNPQNRVLADKDITIFATIKDEAENKENQDIFTMFADISPNKNATGDDFEVYTALNPRLWFADSIKFYDFETNNSSVSKNFVTDNLVLGDGKVVGKIEAKISGERNQNFNYVIPNDVNSDESLNWESGSEIQFVFKVYDSDGNAIWVDGDVNGEIDESIDSSDHPLYAVRLKDESDLSSIDLWSLNIQDIVQQKGGVTILNNVIDSSNDEKTVVEVDVASAGNLIVQVLTLDGNVVKVLQRGRVDSGKYYYHWDGKNIAGDSVARGMYFIRVVGPNLDETRKVMVVQN